MRQLLKGKMPSILSQNHKAWTAQYIEAVKSGGKPPRKYALKPIRDALSMETFGRCAYCESRLHGITWAHVEHILPKSVHPSLVVSWENLTLACPMCNGYKASHDSNDLPLIHPYTDMPALHLQFVGGLVFPQLGDDIGKRTIGVLRLDRAELTQEREYRLERIRALLEDWFRADAGDKGWLAEGIRLDAAQGEFTACVETFLEFWGFS